MTDRQQAAPFRQSVHRSGIDVNGALRGQPAGQPSLARGRGPFRDEHRMTGVRRQRAVDTARCDGERRPRGGGDARGGDLRYHPARSHPRCGPAIGHRGDPGIDPPDARDMDCSAISGIAVIQAVDVGQQQHSLRRRRLRHARG